MTFEYNANAAFKNTIADIIDHAKSLFNNLVHKRKKNDLGLPLSDSKQSKVELMSKNCAELLSLLGICLVKL